MALQTSTGYVRFSISTGMDETTLTVNWLTFHNSNWRENNPRRVWQTITDNGSYTFDLSDGNGGYLPQTMETAHQLLKDLNVRDANFKAINFQIV